VCDLETSRMGAPYIYDISRLRVNTNFDPFCQSFCVYELCSLIVAQIAF